MALSCRVVGVRLGYPGVPDYRVRLYELAAAAPQEIRIFSAYFDARTFAIMSDLAVEGAPSVQAVIAANSAGRTAWQAAKDFDLAGPLGTQLRIARSHPGTILHPKFAVFGFEDRVVAFVGSSNLTEGGTRTNIELNLELEEDLPLSASSPTKSLLDTFDSLFANSTVPTSALWDALIAQAPVRAPIEGRAVPASGSSVLSKIAQVGTDPVSIVVGPQVATVPGFVSLLLELSEADVRRPGWHPDGKGTAQLNLPREATSTVTIPEGEMSGVAVGLNRLVNQTLGIVMNFWPRAARAPGRVPEMPRFTFRQAQKDFVIEDLGRPPAMGDLLIIELPGSTSGLNPVRAAVLDRRAASEMELLPGDTSGSQLGQGNRGAYRWPDGTPLRWAVVNGSVL